MCTVTTTTEASIGLSLMMSGNTYDCVLMDADMYETDKMEAFLHQVLSNQPKMSIALMASVDSNLRIPKEARESEAVFCLLKPCSPLYICDIWKNISRTRFLSQKNVSEKNAQRVDPTAKQSTVSNSSAIDNNISSDNLTDHQALDINSQVDHAMYKQVAYEDLFSGNDDDDDDDDDDVDDDAADDDQEDVDEISRKDTTGVGTTKKADKGKQPLTLKRKNDQGDDDDDEYSERITESKTRVRWKGELDEKFREAMRVLGNEAQSSEIQRYMNVPGLTRFHVASHLQKYHKKRRMFEAKMAEIAQNSSNLQLQSFANERCDYATQSNDNESNIQSTSHRRTGMINVVGSSYVSIENIRILLQQALPLPLPIRNFGDNQIANNNGGQGTESQPIGQGYGNAMEPQVTGDIYSNQAFTEAMALFGFGPTVPSGFSFGLNDNPLLSGDTQTTSHNCGQGTESQLIGHRYGNAMEPQETLAPFGFGATVSSGFNFGLNDNSLLSGDTQTTNNNGGQGTESQLTGHGYGNAMEPQVTGGMSSHRAFEEAMTPFGFGAIMSSDYNLGLNDGNSGDANGNGHSHVQEQVACLEPAKESWVADCGGFSAILNDGQHYLVFDVENSVNPGSSLDSIPLGPASADISIPDQIKRQSSTNTTSCQL
ncbi:hypothetical protein QVD17_31900 [Tagetes erecta]|uniref:Response regulatory domain-containing protein n=1 Tax=Tagetes erecta TaxID=13708 RepID=A0AAD8K8M9_TARER|nr:hypothetical protein QVD17_31900 [Tagetes erecta]